MRSAAHPVDAMRVRSTARAQTSVVDRSRSTVGVWSPWCLERARFGPASTSTPQCVSDATPNALMLMLAGEGTPLIGLEGRGGGSGCGLGTTGQRQGEGQRPAASAHSSQRRHSDSAHLSSHNHHHTPHTTARRMGPAATSPASWRRRTRHGHRGQGGGGGRYGRQRRAVWSMRYAS